MDLTRLLVRLHAKSWQQRYGDEFTAVLEDTRVTSAVVADVAANAAKSHIRANPDGLLLVAALVVSTASRVIAQHAGFAVNVLWAPTTHLQALALLGALSPWVALIVKRWVQARALKGTYGMCCLALVQPLVIRQDDAGPRGYTGLIAILVIAAVVAALIAAITSPLWRRRILRILAVVVGGPLAIYLVIRGIAELWIIDYDDPASYQHDWGGPSLIGVLAVHTGPALVIIIATIVWLVRWRTRRIGG